MKIAIFHNLEKGGALNSLIFLTKNLKKNNYIDIFSFKKNIPQKIANNIFLFNLKNTKNIFSHLIQILFELRIKSKKIAKKINNNNYDLIIIFPCLLTQSPYLLNFIKNKNKCIYFFTEPKREFYEKTSFDYYSIKKIITRFVRLPIKFIDKKNCQKAKHIISNSFYSSNNLEKIYDKKSTVIYPGLKPINPKKIIINNNKKILSVGALSKIKGHFFSIYQSNNLSKEITILGRKTDESQKIINTAKEKNIFLKIIQTEKDILKDKIFKKYSIYLANQEHEPFGISTLEATSNNCIVLGKNEGGTPEIIQNGINGFLYTNLEEAKKILKEILNKKNITLYKTNKIDWKYTTNKLMLYYIQNIKND